MRKYLFGDHRLERDRVKESNRETFGFKLSVMKPKIFYKRCVLKANILILNRFGVQIVRYIAIYIIVIISKSSWI